MEKINCNVIQDILPLYIEDAVSEDTKELVEEHLQNCEICQRVYHETKADLENDMKIYAQTKENSNEANDLKNFRKFLKKKKTKTILLSIAATIVCFLAVFTFMHFEQSLWEKYVSCIFYPYDQFHEILKKDEIKEVYVDKDGTTTTIWEAPEEEQKAYLSEKHTEPLG